MEHVSAPENRSRRNSHALRDAGGGAVPGGETLKRKTVTRAPAANGGHQTKQGTRSSVSSAAEVWRRLQHDRQAEAWDGLNPVLSLERRRAEVDVRRPVGVRPRCRPLLRLGKGFSVCRIERVCEPRDASPSDVVRVDCDSAFAPTLPRVQLRPVPNRSPHHRASE